MPVFPEPTDTLTEPPAPAVDWADSMVINPDGPSVAQPDENDICPLQPFNPAFGVATKMLPLDDNELCPDFK